MSNITNVEAVENERLVGGWTPFHELTAQDREVFNEATEGKILGVNYDPYLVSTQVVNGTNYRFKCHASVPPSNVIWEAIVEIFKPINGEAHVTQIIRL